MSSRASRPGRAGAQRSGLEAGAGGGEEERARRLPAAATAAPGELRVPGTARHPPTLWVLALGRRSPGRLQPSQRVVPATGARRTRARGVGRSERAGECPALRGGELAPGATRSPAPVPALLLSPHAVTAEDSRARSLASPRRGGERLSGLSAPQSFSWSCPVVELTPSPHPPLLPPLPSASPSGAA